MRLIIIIAIHIAAAIVPLSDWQSHKQTISSSFQAWPDEYEGLPIRQLAMSDKERGFSQNFPGKIARFTDGSREIIMRYIEQPSRRVHPSADCLRGSGYTVESQPLNRDQNNHLWGCVLATRNGVSYRICERIYDQSGNSWYDVSSWFWSVLLNNRQGPWWAVTIAREI